MFKSFDDLMTFFKKTSNDLTVKNKQLFEFVMDKIYKTGKIVKVYFEIEKLKWILKKKYCELGAYIVKQKAINSASDFSHDKNYYRLVNEIDKIIVYIEGYKKSIDIK